MNDRLVEIFSLLVLALQYCRANGKKSKEEFINVVKQFGHYKNVTDEEIEKIIEKPIINLLEIPDLSEIEE